MTHPSSSISPTRPQFGQAANWRLGAGVLLMVGLLAFEIFNFDTTQYALGNLMGEVSFAGVRWATVLAIAFCAIDFAGLMRIFTPQADDMRDTWYLMGAWLLAATMNAIMTWWAVTLTLLNHDLGNEILSRTQLVNNVPIFIAVLVWLTRILFIGALTVAGNHLFDRVTDMPARKESQPAPQPAQVTGRSAAANGRFSPPSRPLPRREPMRAPQPIMTAVPVTEDIPDFVELHYVADDSVDEPTSELPAQMPRQPVRPSRINQRPPMPGRQPIPMTAKGRSQK